MKIRCNLMMLMFSFKIMLFCQDVKFEKTYYYKTKILKEEYYCLKKNKYLKHGLYKLYNYNGTLNQIGYYNLDAKNGEWKEFDNDGKVKHLIEYKNNKVISEKKFGVWWKSYEGGKVQVGYDHDKNKALGVKINTQIKYPALAREKGIEGEVKLKVVRKQDCTLVECKVIQGLGYGCDEASLKVVNELIFLTRKYAPEHCANTDTILTLKFRIIE
jgi:antitoxin component YwqK of YwqJK toxin-antitoxin module